MLVVLAAVGLAGGNVGQAQESSPTAQSTSEVSLPYPTFSSCASASPPVLPQRWHAVAVMAPFEDSQLDVGEFVYDAAIPALRATVSGVEFGMIDLLITNEDTFRLTGPRQSPTACASSGPVFKPPSRQWLSEKAQCVGKAPLISGLMEWWKMPSENDAATWHWYKANTRMPWRTSRITPSNNPAVIGGYAMVNFTTFEQLPRTNLAALRDFCRSQTVAPASDASTSVKSARALLEAQPETARDAEGPARAASLISGLDRGACLRVKPPRWPARFEMTAMMISTNFQNGPYLAEVFYDWQGAHAMLTRLHNPQTPSSKATLDGLLTGDVGYHVTRDESGAAACERAYPGLIRPDWMTSDRCQCRGVIKNNPALDRKETIEIYSCPVKPSGVFWSWYNTVGRPITFRSTAVIPAGLTLADYYRWTSKSGFPTEILDLPSTCNKNPLFGSSSAADFTSCAGCHKVTE